VVRSESIRFFIAIATQLNADTNQIDLTTAFLKRKLKEKIYVKQPAGYVKKGEDDKVYIL
jgi:transcription initiation factor TFIIIB Brf1 subunit/transcription initiation factor TFIIB